MEVGMTGLEPATSRPPDACANQLRYIPFHKRVQKYILIVKRPNFWPPFSIFKSKNKHFRLCRPVLDVYVMPVGMPSAAADGMDAGIRLCKRSCFGV